jgi:hypothetical protein
VSVLLLLIIRKMIREGEIHPQWKEHDVPAGPVARPKLDVYGAAALAVVIASFLLFVTTVREGAGAQMPVLFAAMCAASLAAFVMIERRAPHPVVDYRLFKNRTLMSANVMIIIIGFSMFMVFQTIPILAESPKPIGFGADVSEAATIQLPFAVILLIFGPTSGFIVSKMGSVRPAILGSVINVAGFALLALFHSLPWMVSVGLAVISTGLSLGSVGIMNIILLATPQRQMVSSLGNTLLLRIIGSSLGPAMAGVIMQTHLIGAQGLAGRFPSPETYTLIFAGAAALAAISVMMSLMLRKAAAVAPVARA